MLYADDTVLVYVGTKFDELTDHVHNRLRNTLDCCNSDKLSLNLLNFVRTSSGKFGKKIKLTEVFITGMK